MDERQVCEEMEKIAQDIKRLEELRDQGVMPADLAERSIAALRQRLLIYQAQLQGSGAIAQGKGAKAVGKGGALIEGNVYYGTPPTDEKEALQIYLRVLRQRTSTLPLRGRDVRTADASAAQRPLSLANVYVALDTTTTVREVVQREEEGLFGREERTRPLSALEAVLRHPAVVILGDPGSGKTTFLNFLVYCLSSHALEPDKDWLDYLPGWPEDEADVVPLLLLLRDLARSYADNLPQQPAPEHLWRFIEQRLRSQNLSFFAVLLQRLLEQGKVLVLLDGLDEVPTPEQRLFVRDAVQAFRLRYPHNRYAITCRVRSYQPPVEEGRPDLRLRDGLSNVLLPTYELAPFDEPKIDAFIEAWYGELVRAGSVREEERPSLVRSLKAAVRRKDIRRLAPNPLLLTVMALVHAHEGELPGSRALLYEKAIDMLLWRWEQMKMGGERTPELRRLLDEAGRQDMDLKRVLWQEAYEAQAQVRGDGDEVVADIAEERLLKALARLKRDGSEKGDLNWAAQVIEVIKQRAGLLLEREPGVFAFPHRTFQEYLAGAHLASQATFAEEAKELARRGWEVWREVILYAVGRLVYVSGDMAKPLLLVGELCPGREEDSEDAWWLAWLAGDVLLEIGLQRVGDSALGEDLLERVRDRLVSLLQKGRLTPRQRADAGNTLAKLGDPRFDPDYWYLPREPLLGFVPIPEGEFIMGSDPKKDPQAVSDEQPQHSLSLLAYYIGRYPVTVAQFRAFVKPSKYKPRDKDSLRGVDTHPVVWVAWYDALAYARWLDERLRKLAPKRLKEAQSEVEQDFWRGLAERRYHVTLPSEAEWEKATRGGVEIPEHPFESGDGCLAGLVENPDPDRIYPWGNEPDPNRANYDQTGIVTTSAVGCFPGGESPYGVEEMSGNVWEWTRSLWGREWGKPDYSYPYEPMDGRENLDASSSVDRVLRGGSFVNDVRNVRCVVRDGGSPSGRSRVDGFRVVVSPFGTDR